eukprot:403371228
MLDDHLIRFNQGVMSENYSEIQSLIEELIKIITADSNSQDVENICTRFYESGFYLNFSIVLQRTFQNPYSTSIISNYLWILEELSSEEQREIHEIIQTGILQKVFDLINKIYEFLMFKSLELHYQNYQGDQEVEAFKQNLVQTLTIIGNVAADSDKSRKELYRYKILSVLNKLISYAQTSSLEVNQVLEEKLIWILSNITENFDKSQICQVNEGYVQLILNSLYSQDDERISNALTSLINISNIDPGISVDIFIKCDQVNSVIHAGPLFQWLFQVIEKVCQNQRLLSDNSQPEQDAKILEKVLQVIGNFVASDDHNVFYQLQIDLETYLLNLLHWNQSNKSNNFRDKTEIYLTVIYNNLQTLRKERIPQLAVYLMDILELCITNDTLSYIHTDNIDWNFFKQNQNYNIIEEILKNEGDEVLQSIKYTFKNCNQIQFMVDQFKRLYFEFQEQEIDDFHMAVTPNHNNFQF